MSKQLFEFVKVAAGEPVDVGSLVCYMQPDVRAMVRELSFGPGGKAPHDFWFLRPAESPDAGRDWQAEENRLNPYGKECDQPAFQQFKLCWGEGFRQGLRSKKPSLPATDVGDIPAGREGFIDGLLSLFKKYSYQLTEFEISDWVRSHWPTPADPDKFKDVVKDMVEQFNTWTSEPERAVRMARKVMEPFIGELYHDAAPADPGSQVEAVDPAKLLEWVRKNGFFPDIDNEWTKYNHGTRSYEVFKDADLITLYKQSL